MTECESVSKRYSKRPRARSPPRPPWPCAPLGLAGPGRLGVGPVGRAARWRCVRAGAGTLVLVVFYNYLRSYLSYGTVRGSIRRETQATPVPSTRDSCDTHTVQPLPNPAGQQRRTRGVLGSRRPSRWTMRVSASCATTAGPGSAARRTMIDGRRSSGPATRRSVRGGGS